MRRVKVRAVCPSCGRPASAPGRSECLYCGAPLAAVVTGSVTAAGSGKPIEVAGASLKGPPPAAPPPMPRPSWMDYGPDERPVARLFENGWVRLFLVVAFVLAGVLVLAKVIDDHRPAGYTDAPARP